MRLPVLLAAHFALATVKRLPAHFRGRQLRLAFAAAGTDADDFAAIAENRARGELQCVFRSATDVW